MDSEAPWIVARDDCTIVGIVWIVFDVNRIICAERERVVPK